MFIGKQAKKGINVVEGGRTALATYLVHPVYKQMIVMVTNYVDLQINDFKTNIFKNEKKVRFLFREGKMWNCASGNVKPAKEVDTSDV